MKTDYCYSPLPSGLDSQLLMVSPLTVIFDSAMGWFKVNKRDNNGDVRIFILCVNHKCKTKV